MAKNKISLILVFNFLFVFMSFSQQVKEDSGVRSVRAQYENYYSSKSELSGYRIQIVTTTDRREMETKLKLFRQVYPDLFHEWKYSAPYYRIIVGAYLKKRKAKEALYHFRKKFPGSILVFSDIQKKELIIN